MWGPNGQPFHLNINQQLFNINQNDTLSFGGIVYFFGLPFGAQFDLITHLLLASTFSISGFHTGWVDVDYPVRIDLTFPSPYTFMPGDWITINSRYHVMNGWNLNSSFPQDGVISLDLDFGVSVTLTGTVCFGACDNFTIINAGVPDDSIPIISIDQQNGTATYPCMQNGQISFCHDTILPIVFNNAWGTGISGVIGLPYIVTTDHIDSTELCHKKLIAQGDDPYAHFTIDIIQFLWAISNLLPQSTAQPLQQFLSMLTDTINIGGGISISYNLLSAYLNITNTLQQDLTFNPTIWNHFTLPTAVQYYVTDPNQNNITVDQGNSNQITFQACHDLHIKYPCFGYPQFPIGIAHSLSNEFTNHTWDSVAFSLTINAFEFWINLPFFFKSLQNDSINIEYYQQNPQLFIDTLKKIIASKNYNNNDSLKHFALNSINDLQKIEHDSIFLNLLSTRSSIHIGPLISYNIPLGYIPITWFNETWELAGFNDTIFPPETLFPLPEMSINLTGKMCFEDTVGTLTATITHGRPPYTYTWSNGVVVTTTDTLNEQTGFSPGTNYVTVTDANGCSLVGSYTITGNNPQIFYQFNVQDALCHGTASGSVTVIPSGGTPGFTYQWSNGSTTQTNSPITAGTYTVTITDAIGCTTVGQVTVSEPATYVSLNVDSIVKVECLGGTTGAIYLTTQGGTPGYNYVWNNNQTTEDIINIPSGTYTVTVIDHNGCTLVQTYVVPQVPHCCMTPYAGPDANVCGYITNLQASSPSPGNTAHWEYINGPGTAIFVNQNNPNSQVIVNAQGTYTFVWHEFSSVCDSLDTVQITFITQPQANAGPQSVSVCGTSYTLNAIYSVPNSTGTWQLLPPQQGYFVPNNSTPNATFYISSGYQSYYLTWTENNLGCTSVDTIRLDFHEMPMPDAGPDLTTCGNVIQLSVNSTYPGYWTSSNPTATFYPSNTSFNPTVNIVQTSPTQVDTFIFTAYSDYCTNYDTVLVTFSIVPHAEAGSTQAICGYTAQLAADTIGSGATSGYWTTNNPGVIITYNGTSPIQWNATASVANPSSFFANTDYQEVYLYWHVQSGPGCQSYDSVKIIFNKKPDAYAGNDTVICGKKYFLHATPSLLNPSGMWSTLSGPGTANFVNPTQAQTMVTVTQYGIYQFIWKEMNSNMPQCYDTDTITVEFLIAPEPDAGLDTAVCGKFAHICATPSIPGGHWSGPSGISYYDGPNGNYNPSYQDSACTWIRWPSENDTITMYWVEFNGICYGYDSVNVYFGAIAEAIILTNPADSLICGPSYPYLSANPPSVGYGYWIDNVYNTTFTPSPYAHNNVVATIGSGGTSYYGPHYFYWITVNGSCRDTSNAHYVRFIPQPEANAGGNYWPGLFGANSHIKTDTVCGLNYQMNAIYSIQGATGTWYSLDPSNVYFVNGVGNHTTTHVHNDSLYLLCNGCYTVFNANTPYRDFIWQEQNEICFDSDTLRLYFAPRPNGQFTATTPPCRYDSSTIIAHTWNLPNHVNYGITEFHWFYPGGVLSSTITDPLHSDTIYVSWQSGEQHIVQLITVNKWGCFSGLVTQFVNEPPKFNPQTNISPSTCGNCNGEIELSTTYIDNQGFSHPNYYTFNWLDTNSNSLIRTGICPNSLLYVVVNGQSISPNAAPGTICHDTISIFVPDTGTVIASFDTTVFQQHEVAPYQVTMINTTYNGRKYSWRIYDSNNNLVYTSTASNPTIVFEDEGCYTIILIATSKEGCIDTAIYKPLCVDKQPIFEVPNVFTPNGDGQNDVFKVHGEAIDEFEAKIYNRWGRKIYEWNDINGYWDGKITGTEASPGVYYIVIKAKDRRGKTYKYEGYIHLIREK
jgi:gliding motility-associated-like protein